MDAAPGHEQEDAYDGAPASMQPVTASAPSAAAREAGDPPGGGAPDWALETTHGTVGAEATGSGRRLTHRHLAVGALLAVAVAVAAIVLTGGGHAKGSATTTGVPAGDTTATVARRTLAESSTVDGTLGYGATLELYDRLSGTYTWLPSVGATIARGGALFRLDTLPVVLMYGSVPAYRTLEEGISDGPDVAQLNDNLIALGYDPSGAIPGSSTDGKLEGFTAATAAAVDRWQKAEGLPVTGEVELGRVVFAPSARRVTSLHVALGQDPPGAPAQDASAGEAANEPAGESPPKAGESPSEAGESPPGKGNENEKADSRKAKRKPASADKPKQQGHSQEDDSKTAPSDGSGAKNSPSSSNKSKEPSKAGDGGEGAGASAGEPVLTTTSTQQLVQLKLKAEEQQLARVGQRAPVTLPGGGVVLGTIIDVGTVASEAKGAEDEKGGAPNEGNGESTIPVTLALAHRVPHLDQAPVSVELVKSVRHDVLAVPATALTATGAGGYAIQVLEDDRRVELPVTPGMFAGGYVQVEGAGLHEGQTVIESE